MLKMVDFTLQVNRKMMNTKKVEPLTTVRRDGMGGKRLATGRRGAPAAPRRGQEAQPRGPGDQAGFHVQGRSS